MLSSERSERIEARATDRPISPAVDKGKRVRLAHAVAAIVCIAGVVLCFLPPPAGAAPEVMRVAGVVAIAVGLWLTAALPEFFTSLIFFFLAVTVAGQAPSIVFSGFHSSAVWMIFGGLVMALAVQSTGLGGRVARATIGWVRGSYTTIIAGLVLTGTLAGFAIPSNTGRIVILLPIVLAFAEKLGFRPGSNGYVGLALAISAGTMFPSFGILPGAVPNLGLAGAAESLYGIRITYGQYFYLLFPVLGGVAIVALPFVLRALYPARPERAEAEAHSTPMSAAERRVAYVLAGALALWITDFWHGVSPAWIAVGAAIVLLMPRIGVVPPTAVVEKLNLGPWFFVAGLIGMGAVVTKSGLGALLGKALFAVLPLAPGHDFANFVSVSAIGMGMGLVTTMPGVPAIMSALAGHIAEATGWPLLTALLAQAHTWAMALFPYQLPPLIVAMYLSRIRPAQVIRLLVAMCAVTWLAAVPLQYLWWRALGMFG
jgi:di/tricarboxylate transporter